MFENIEEIEKKYNLKIDKNRYDENMVLSIFNSLEIREEEYDLNMSFLIGLYCFYVKTDNTNAKKYYLMAIEKGNDDALNNLGIIYINEKDYENAKKYYLMAIEKGYVNAIYNLGNLYCIVEKDYENAKKYYLMAIEKGNDSAMNNLGTLYCNVEKDYENAKKYYLMAIEKGSDTAINNIKYIMNDLELYICLNEIINKNELIENEIKRLRDIKKFK
uniref:UDP-N-acetylglucosamine--peptide N-acetylglucosaminyltransferase SPINDLY n=1 Tax=viral metagenome TaxID=1070528 RepID=A0A6C0H5D4_9ZZZZ